MNKHLRTAFLATTLGVVAAAAALYFGREDFADGANPNTTQAEGTPVAALATEHSAVPTQTPTRSTSAGPVWTVDNIRDLQPLAPARNDIVPRAIPSLEAYDTALATLAPAIDQRAGDPDNAWAIAHGLLARGPEFRIADGRAAIPHLFSVFAEARPAGALALQGFPRERDGKPVEAHTDLILKNLTEIGLDPTTEFPMAGGMATGADLYRYTLLKTFLRAADNKSNFDSPADMSWGLQSLAAWAPSETVQWQALDGTPMDLDTLADFVALVMTKESKFMFDQMRAGESFERKGQSLFLYPCGGAHLVQGASYAVGRGYGGADAKRAVEAQVGLLFYRLPIELEIYADAAKKNRLYRKKLAVQRLKFLGHWLESVSKLQIMGFFTPDEMQLQIIEGAAQNLILVVRELDEQGVFRNLDIVRVEDPQMYLDVVGDSAHAVRGLELALGRQTLRW